MVKKALLLFALLAGCAFAQNRVFELRTYTCYEGKLEALKARFRDHTIEIFKRHGMESIGYWVPSPAPSGGATPDRSQNTLIYIIAHASREQANKNWAAFRADPEWQKVSAASEANGKLVIKVDSVYMEPTSFSMLK